MPATTQLATSVLAKAQEDRPKLLKVTHPLYDEFSDIWNTLLDAYEGTGGFLDGGYLDRYPNELDEDYSARQARARYHNYAKAIVNLYVRHVFSENVQRETKDEGLTAWWQNVDKASGSMLSFLKRATKMALAIGHIGILIDKTPEEPTGPTKRDETSVPFLTLYTPQVLLDWRQDDLELVGVKLAEAVKTLDLLEEMPTGDDAIQYLLWTKDEWARFDAHGEFIADGAPDIGRVPFVVLRPEPSAQWPFLGQSLLGNANVFKALFNRASEEDQVLRDQAFSVLTVNVPPDIEGGVENVKKQLGRDIGTTRVLVANGTMQYATPDMTAPQTIRENQTWLIREIYRMAHVVYQSDSREAQTAEAIRLQHAELNEMLVGLAGQLTSVEHDLAQLYFAWTTPTPEAAEAAYEAAEVTITYPREFFVAELAQELADLAEAIALQLGPTATVEIKRKAVHRLLPDLDEQVLDKIEQELEQVSQETPQQQVQQVMGNFRQQVLANAKQQQLPGEAAA